MNRTRPKRKILLALSCVVALLALGPVADAVGGGEMNAEPQPAGVASPTVEGAVAEEPVSLHAEVVRGLPFSRFDIIALVVVLLGLTTISFAVHRLNREPAERSAPSPVTTDAE